MTPRGDFQLALGYWIVSHKAQLRTWWVIVLLAFMGLSLVWAIIFFFFFFLTQPRFDNLVGRAAASLADLQPSSAVQPQPLVVGPVAIIGPHDGSVDLVAMVNNPNHGWGAKEVIAQFTLGGEALEIQRLWLNPGSERPVMQLNVSVGQSAPGSATLQVTDVIWARAASAAVPPPSFTVEQVTLTPTTVTIGSQRVLTVNLTATVTNRSVYSFLKVRVPVVIKAGPEIVAVDELVLDRWPTLTTKTINRTWQYPVATASQAVVSPQINQFDRDNLYR
ncbi:MAG: hypothetical protein HYY50_03825 [Candidatus Kerfeldbacteria bacterium]|nr:hypothetical protein [Candidatus Kerfeldbacteria bacterium]